MLKEFRHRVELALDGCLPDASIPPSRLHEAMRYATLNGGKRIRACLVYAAGRAVGALDEMLDVPACAVELVHAYSLVHDDLPCMDDDDLRRSKPTCHRAYDEATALLVGDALLTLAFELLASNGPPVISPAQRVKMIATLSGGIGSRGMAGGQAIDLASVGKKLSPHELEDMHRRKTGALIRTSVLLGTLAREGVEPRVMEALDRYGQAIGLAFQIADDILDVEGKTEALGKTAGADEARNKPTYPAILGLDGAKARATELHCTALESLAPLGDNGHLLAEIADYIVERTQ